MGTGIREEGQSKWTDKGTKAELPNREERRVSGQ